MEPPSSTAISIQNATRRRAPRGRILRAVSTVLHAHRVPAGREVAILLTDDEEMRELNQRYRGLDEATDVLTFPAGDFPGPVEAAPLGDVAISVPFAERQAAARGVSTDAEIATLALHGALHLVGFDDEDEEDRHRMQAEMARLMPAAGLRPDPEWASVGHGEGDR